MNKTELIFGTYNGLPPGSTDVELEHAYQRSYKPFLTTLYKYPTVTAAIHYSGTLLTWLHDRHPEFLMLLNDMVKRNQIEMLGGAFYEPLLPLIPASDRSGQIELLTTYLRRRFGKRPRGIWIPEFAWEPSLPVSLKNCGMEYTFLDAAMFDEADIPSREQFRPVKTEDQGKSIEVFAVQSSFGLTDAFDTDKSDPEQYLKKIVNACPSGGESVIAVFDAGEALGLWGRNDLLYGEREWLSRFFGLLAANISALTTVLPKEYVRRPHRADRCYFGCTKAESLSKWWYIRDAGNKEVNASLKKRGRALLPAGSLRQIVRRYPESAHLHAKMMHVHLVVNQIRGDRYRKKAAREELWKGQSGYALWHGQTDGIKRNGIRKASYTALIEAEKIARERGIFKAYASRDDFDLDGLDEYLFMGNVLNVYVHTVGGVAFELDYLPSAWNYLDTMGRYEEPYHGSLIPEQTFDRSPRRAFLDRVVPIETGFDEFQAGTFEVTDDLSNHVYEVYEYRRDHLEVGLSTTWRDRLSLTKKYTLIEERLLVRYTLSNLSETEPLRQAFLSELNLSFASNNEEFLQIRAYDEGGNTVILRGASSAERATRFDARDLKNAVTIEVSLDEPLELWSLPIVSQWYSRSGLRTGYQTSAFIVRRAIELEPLEATEFFVQLDFKP